MKSWPNMKSTSVWMRQAMSFSITISRLASAGALVSRLGRPWAWASDPEVGGVCGELSWGALR